MALTEHVRAPPTNLSSIYLFSFRTPLIVVAEGATLSRAAAAAAAVRDGGDLGGLLLGLGLGLPFGVGVVVGGLVPLARAAEVVGRGEGGGAAAAAAQAHATAAADARCVSANMLI